MLGHAALGTMDLSGRIVLGPVHGHQQIAVDRAIRLELAAATQRLHHRGKHRKQGTGRHWIEQIAGLIGRRDLGDPKQAQGVVAPLGNLQRALEIQPRGALREEHRERPQGGIGHRIGRLARALIREALHHRAQVLDQVAEQVGANVESKWEAHQRGKSACTFPPSYTGRATKCPVPHLRVILVRIYNCWDRGRRLDIGWGMVSTCVQRVNASRTTGGKMLAFSSQPGALCAPGTAVACLEAPGCGIDSVAKGSGQRYLPLLANPVRRGPKMACTPSLKR